MTFKGFTNINRKLQIKQLYQPKTAKQIFNTRKSSIIL